VSTNDTGEESSEADAGNGADNGTNSGRGIVLEAVAGRCGEKLEHSKNVTSADAKYFLVEELNTSIPFEL